MWEQYAPEPRMRLNLGIRRRLAPLLDNDRRKIEMANSLLFTLPGAPIIYYGDEIGMGDNIELPDRNGLRTPMQWDASPSAGFSQAASLYSPLIDLPPYGYQVVNVAAQKADPTSLWHTIRKMILLRKQHPAFGEGDLSWIEGGTDAVLAFYRSTPQERLLLVHNLSPLPQQVSLELNDPQLMWTDLFVDQPYIAVQHELQLHLAPYQFLWLR